MRSPTSWRQPQFAGSPGALGPSPVIASVLEEPQRLGDRDLQADRAAARVHDLALLGERPRRRARLVALDLDQPAGPEPDPQPARKCLPEASGVEPRVAGVGAAPSALAAVAAIPLSRSEHYPA